MPEAYGANPVFGIIFDKLTLYPSPYIVVTETGYTKHYYAGTEKIATQIGDGGLMTQEGKLESKHQERIKEGFYDSFQTEYFKCDITTNADIENDKRGEVQYQCKCFEQADIKRLSLNPMLEPVMNKWRNGSKNNNEVYYTHANHLGSASWITDRKGDPVQYIHYAPYGELIANQQVIGYDERFKFTGKERDEESGYDYFGARYYTSAYGFWTAVDPLADKNPNVTPYIYCNGNPVMLVDPDGREVKIYLLPKDELRPGAVKFRQEHIKSQTKSLTLFMHGYKGGVFMYNPAISTKKYILARDGGLNDLISIVLKSDTWKNKSLKDKIIILNACSTGNGKENVAKKASGQLKGFLNNSQNDYYTGGDVYMIAPIAPVANDDENQKQGWHLYKNGRQLTTKNGCDTWWFKGTPTEKEVKQWIQKCD